jgi:hypothetical protein
MFFEMSSFRPVDQPQGVSPMALALYRFDVAGLFEPGKTRDIVAPAASQRLPTG